MRALHAIVAIALVASSAAAGVAAYAGVFEPAASPMAAVNEEFALETFEKEFDGAVLTGALDLRIDYGAVRVVGWDRNAYRITVYEVPSDDELVSDHETAIEFTDGSTDDHLDLSLTVDRRGTYGVAASESGIRVGDTRVDRAIVAYVPASALYESVFACAAQSGRFLSLGDLAPDVVPTDDDEPACLAAEDGLDGGIIRINLDSEDHADLNVTSGVEGLAGAKLDVLTHYGDVTLADARFDAVNAIVRYGELDARGIEADSIELAVSYGDVTLEAGADALDVVARYGSVKATGDYAKASIVTDYGDIGFSATVAEASLAARYGDVVAWLNPAASGKVGIVADYGNVDVTLERPAGVGYAVDAVADYGRVDIVLEDAKVKRPAERDGSHSAQASATTNGYDDAPTQVELSVVTRYGDVLVTDGSEPDEEDEDASGTTAGRDAGLLGIV